MWIDEFREGIGMERDEFARRVRVLGARKRPGRPIGCSETLVYILERRKGAITHPVIASLLAEACGATSEQRDSIVAKKYRGGWSGDGVPRIRAAAAPRPAAVEKPKATRELPNGRDVVMIDGAGRVVRRYTSMTQAAVESGQGITCVYDRVHRRVKREFDRFGYTFRMWDEWKEKNEDERRADLTWVAAFGGKL